MKASLPAVAAGLFLILAAQPSAGQTLDLPERMEAPAPQGDGTGDGKPEAPPVPPARPPIPTERPDRSEDPDSGEPEGGGRKSTGRKPPAEKSPDVMPREEIACRHRLRSLGVAFAEHEPLSDENGCSVPHPLLVTGLPGGVMLQPGAVMNCAMAEATATFVRDVASPMAAKEFGSPLKTLNQASAYVCRPRNGQTKLSEHAFGNALDWASMELVDGTRIDVRSPRSSEPRRARLLAGIRGAACGPFKTVLGPGSDADHANHFHFDLAKRRNGGTFCQ